MGVPLGGTEVHDLWSEAVGDVIYRHLVDDARQQR